MTQEIPELRVRAKQQAMAWFGLLGGPAVWGVHLGLNYAFVPEACAAGGAALLHVFTVVLLAAGVASLLAAWKVRSAALTHADERVGERNLFLGTAGMALAGLFIGVIFMEGLQPLFIDPCL